MHNLICHLIDANVETNYFRSIARHHDRERFPVMIGSIAPAGSLQEAMKRLDAPTFSLRATARREYTSAVLRLAGILRREKVSIVHAHCFDPTFVGLMAARLARAPFVFTRHHSDHNIRLGKKWHTRIDGWCARRADRVIAVSEFTRRIMIEVEHVPAHKITVVHNGMEPLRSPAPENVEKVKRELGLSNEKVCLMLARLHEEKGHRYLFEAAPRIESRIGPFTILLAGDGPHQSMLEEEVRARKLEGTVRFLGRRDDVPELLSLSSVVALPSLAESFGFVMVEAMSFGKPVVAAATGGIPEVVVEGETGLLVPPADSQSLADAICRVLEDEAFAKEMGERGRERAAAFTFERMMSGYESVYEKIAGHPTKEKPYGERSTVSATE